MFTEKDLRNFGKGYGNCEHFNATGLKNCMGSDLCKRTLKAVLVVTKDTEKRAAIETALECEGSRIEIKTD